MEKFARALMTEGSSISSNCSRGFSIAADGTWYLYSDGVVRKRADLGMDGVYAFWPTSQEAEEFYWNWHDKQGIATKPKECGCGELHQRIAELEAERDKRGKALRECVTVIESIPWSYDGDGGAENKINVIVDAALTQGEEK